MNMAKLKGVEIAKCPNCKAAVGDENPHPWCIECGEPLPNEIKALIPHLAKPQGEVSATPSEQSHSRPAPTDGLVTALNFIGWVNLIASLILGFYIWSSFGSAEVVAGTYYPYREKVTNYTAIGAGIAVIAQGFIVLVFCLAIARILEHVSAIRNSLVSKQEKGS
jgi:hypothetical protein